MKRVNSSSTGAACNPCESTIEVNAMDSKQAAWFVAISQIAISANTCWPPDIFSLFITVRVSLCGIFVDLCLRPSGYRIHWRLIKNMNHDETRSRPLSVVHATESKNIYAKKSGLSISL